jgi:hypothetical protein
LQRIRNRQTERLDALIGGRPLARLAVLHVGPGASRVGPDDSEIGRRAFVLNTSASAFASAARYTRTGSGLLGNTAVSRSTY